MFETGVKHFFRDMYPSERVFQRLLRQRLFLLDANPEKNPSTLCILCLIACHFFCYQTISDLQKIKKKRSVLSNLIRFIVILFLKRKNTILSSVKVTHSFTIVSSMIEMKLQSNSERIAKTRSPFFKTSCIRLEFISVILFDLFVHSISVKVVVRFSI